MWFEAYEHYLTFLVHYVSKKGIRDNLMCDMKLLEMIKYEIFTCLSENIPPAFYNNYYKILRVCVYKLLYKLWGVVVVKESFEF